MYALSGIIVMTDGSLRKGGAMGAVMVSKEKRISALNVNTSIYGLPSSINPKLTGILQAV